jgi:ribonuclease HI
MNSFELSRNWFNFSFENPEKVTPNHTALYFFAIEHCNRLGNKEKFGLPTEMAKEAIGIKSWHTYIKAFNDIVNWGFFKLLERSKNQYSSNIIALINNNKASIKALDKAFIKHASKQSQSTHQSNDSIIKQETIKQETINNIEFDVFWNLYDKKIGKKEKLIEKWNKLTDNDRQLIIDYIPKYIISQPDKKYRKNPDTFFNNKSWNDEIIGLPKSNIVTSKSKSYIEEMES